MSRHVRHNRLLGLGAVALSAFLVACGGGEQMVDQVEGTSAAALSGAGAPAMIVYSPRGKPVSEQGMVWMGPVEAHGGRVLAGEPKIYARIDHSRNGVTAGLFKATTGKIEVTFPSTEHSTILEGEVSITDETGQTHVYKAGDSYLIRQGQVVIWEVTGKHVIKSFFNTVEAP